MLSSKTDNKAVKEMYKGKAYIETNITLFTEIDEELKKKFLDRLDLIEPIMKEINFKVEEILQNSLEDNSDIAEMTSSVRGKLGGQYE